MDKYTTIFGSVCAAAVLGLFLCLSSCAVKLDATGEARRIKALEAFKVCVSAGHHPAEYDRVNRTDRSTN
jgi:hypothetical protein